MYGNILKPPPSDNTMKSISISSKYHISDVAPRDYYSNIDISSCIFAFKMWFLNIP